MSNQKGYQQAVENLAYHINLLTDATYSDMFDDNPWLADIEDGDEQIDACRQFMSEDEENKWAELDYIFEVIVDSYKCDPQKLWDDVFVQILKYDAESGLCSPEELIFLLNLDK